MALFEALVQWLAWETRRVSVYISKNGGRSHTCITCCLGGCFLWRRLESTPVRKIYLWIKSRETPLLSSPERYTCIPKIRLQDWHSKQLLVEAVL